MRRAPPPRHTVTDPQPKIVLWKRRCWECKAECWLERMWTYRIAVGTASGPHQYTHHICTVCAPDRRSARLLAARESADRVAKTLDGEPPLSEARAQFPIPTEEAA